MCHAQVHVADDIVGMLGHHFSMLARLQLLPNTYVYLPERSTAAAELVSSGAAASRNLAGSRLARGAVQPQYSVTRADWHPIIALCTAMRSNA